MPYLIKTKTGYNNNNIVRMLSEMNVIIITKNTHK